MKIDFGREILDLKGEPVSNGDATLTLGFVVINAMFAQGPDDKDTTADQKVKQFTIALAADKGGIVDMPTENVEFMKKRIAKAYGPLVVGRAFEIIEG